MVEQKLSAPVEKVHALLTDPKWLEARSRAMGELSASCKAKRSPTGVAVTMQRRLHREMNAIIAKVLNPDSDIAIEEHWRQDGKGYRGTYALQIVGKPVSATADFELMPQGKGCIYRINHKVKVSVPLIGAVVQKFVLGQVEEGCTDELAYLTKVLASTK